MVTEQEMKDTILGYVSEGCFMSTNRWWQAMIDIAIRIELERRGYDSGTPSVFDLLTDAVDWIMAACKMYPNLLPPAWVAADIRYRTGRPTPLAPDAEGATADATPENKGEHYG